jgi:hypothetical protein
LKVAAGAKEALPNPSSVAAYEADATEPEIVILPEVEILPDIIKLPLTVREPVMDGKY